MGYARILQPHLSSLELLFSFQRLKLNKEKERSVLLSSPYYIFTSYVSSGRAVLVDSRFLNKNFRFLVRSWNALCGVYPIQS